jgi:hypothetical protein
MKTYKCLNPDCNHEFDKILDANCGGGVSKANCPKCNSYKHGITNLYKFPDLERWINIYNAYKIEFELKETDDEFEIFINNGWAYVSVTFTKEGQFKQHYVSDF